MASARHKSGYTVSVVSDYSDKEQPIGVDVDRKREVAKLKRSVGPVTFAERLQQIIENKDVENAFHGETWSIIDDSTMVISLEGQEPGWLQLIKAMRDDGGNLPTGVEVSCSE